VQRLASVTRGRRRLRGSLKARSENAGGAQAPRPWRECETSPRSGPPGRPSLTVRRACWLAGPTRFEAGSHARVSAQRHPAPAVRCPVCGRARGDWCRPAKACCQMRPCLRRGVPDTQRDPVRSSRTVSPKAWFFKRKTGFRLAHPPMFGLIPSRPGLPLHALFYSCLFGNPRQEMERFDNSAEAPQAERNFGDPSGDPFHIRRGSAS